MLDRGAIESGAADMADVFHFAMVDWAQNGRATTKYFQRVIELAKLKPRKDANHLQCLALCSLMTGDSTAATDHFAAAQPRVGAEAQKGKSKRIRPSWHSVKRKNNLQAMKSFLPLQGEG